MDNVNAHKTCIKQVMHTFYEYMAATRFGIMQLNTPKAVKHEGGIFLKNFPGLIYTKSDEESEKHGCETIG